MNKIIVKRWVAVSMTAVLLLSACGEQVTPEQRLSNATEAHSSGDYRTALIELKNLLRETPDNMEARILLASTSMKLGDAAAGEKELARAESLGAPRERIYAQQLRSLLMQSKHEQIINGFDPNILTQEPDRSIARIYYANALHATGQQEAAAKEFVALATNGPTADVRSDAMLGQAELAKVNGDLAGAANFVQQALRETPTKAAALLAQGQIMLAQKDFAGALAVFSMDTSNIIMEMSEKFVFRSGEVEAALGINDAEHAKRAANELHALSPEHPVTNYLLARVAFADGDKDLAFERIQDVTGRFPDFRPAMFLHGALSLERGEFQQAEMFLSSVVAAQPGNNDARKLLAESLVRQNKNEEAVSVLQQALDSGVSDKSLVNLLGRVQLRTGNQDSNIDLLTRALQENPDDEQLILTLAAAYVAAGRADEAVQLYEANAQVIDQADGSKRGMILKILAAIQDNDLRQANEHAKIAAEQFPDDRQMMSLIAGMYMSQGKNDLAEEIYRRLMTQDVEDSTSLVNLGRIKIREEKYDEAIKLYGDYLQQHPDDISVSLSMAFAMQAKGDLDGAFATLAGTVERHPGEEMPALVFTRALLVKGELDRAQEVAAQILALKPESAQANFGMGLVQFRLKEFELALNSFNKSNELRPGQIEALVYKARSESRLKRFAQAIKSYYAVKSINPKLFEANRSLVMLETHAGNRSQAQDVLREMRKLYPGDPRILEIEGDLSANAKNHKKALASYSSAYDQAPSRSLAIKLAQSPGVENTESAAYLRRWLEESPDDVSIRLLLAQRLQSNEKFDEAANEYEKVLQIETDNPLAMNNLAWIYYESGKSESQDRAVELARNAYDLRRESPQIADTYGWILFRSGEVKEGEEVLAQAYARARDAKSRSTSDIGYHYAVALKENGDRTRARNLLEQLLNQQAPFAERENAQKLLGTLQR